MKYRTIYIHIVGLRSLGRALANICILSLAFSSFSGFSVTPMPVPGEKNWNSGSVTGVNQRDPKIQENVL